MRELLALLSLRRAFWLWFGGIWLFVGAVFLPVGLWVGSEERRFEQDGVEVTGTVLTKGFDRADSDNESTDYWITYRFTTPDGRMFNGRGYVGADRWDELEERGPVEVQYLPDEPSNNRLRRESDRVMSFIFIGFSVLFAPAGAVLFAKGVRDVLRTRALMREGVVTEATVMRIEDSDHTVNGVPQRRIVYQYVNDLGWPHAGSSELSPEEATAWSEGDVGRVRYNRGLPEQSMWLGRAERPRVAEPGAP